MFKIDISDPKSGKSWQVELKDPEAQQLIGKKIGDTFRGELLGLTGYEFKITGGSDIAGFPMHPDYSGTGRVRALLKPGIGFHKPKKFKGIRKRKTVHRNTIDKDIVQINCIVVKAGPTPLEEALKKEPKESKAN